MRKFALLFLVAVLSFGFVGCAGTFKKPQNLPPDPTVSTVVGAWITQVPGKNQLEDAYIVVFEDRERFAMVYVDKASFESVHEGDKVELGLLSATYTEDYKYFLETEYVWKVSGREYPVIFKWDAKERPMPPKADPKKS